jgi:hypothetical protein
MELPEAEERERKLEGRSDREERKLEGVVTGGE